MSVGEWGRAVVLGMLEGATEFIPVSSTGHLLVARELIGFNGPSGFVFEVVIQLGAIAAMCWIYRHNILRLLVRAPVDPKERRLALALGAAFLPSMILGALGHDFIKTVLFKDLSLIAVMLIVGGGIILLIEKYLLKAATIHSVETVTLAKSVGIGLAQAVAMIPGVSRSGATIMGGLLMGLDRKTAAEFSFLLAIPTMLGAVTLDLFKNRNALDLNGMVTIGVGFFASFVTAFFVVRSVLSFIQRYGYVPFAFYRIALGIMILAVIWGAS